MLSSDNIFAQEQDLEDFLDWPPETNYNLIFLTIAIILAIAVIANYLWSNRKGRKFSAE